MYGFVLFLLPDTHVAVAEAAGVTPRGWLVAFLLAGVNIGFAETAETTLVALALPDVSAASRGGTHS